MAIEDYRSIEFGVCTYLDGQEIFYRVPIDDTVRITLVEMLESFYDYYMEIEGDPENFQASEKYSSTEKLRIDLNHEYLESLRNLYDNNRIPISLINFTEVASNTYYYFGIFKHINGTKHVAIKRPTQFKGLLRKKLIRFIDDTLQSVPDDIFKLDNDFDFVIHDTEIDILHPSGFIFISNMEEEILQGAIESTGQLSNRIEFINFNVLTDFIGRSKTAAKLIASIKSRDDLERTSQRKLLRRCRSLGILVRTENDQIYPEDNSIIDFLQLLDRREYDVDLTDDDPEVYIAGSRKRKQ